MIRQILLVLFVFVILGLIVVWILSGGPRRVYNSVRSFTSATSSSEFRLPWQPVGLFPSVDIGGLPSGEEGPRDSSLEKEMSTIKREFGEVEKKYEEARTFGDPSPLFGKVRIVPLYSSPHSEDVNEEYIGITVPPEQPEAILVAGWSLQSAVSGVRVYFPAATREFMMGSNNSRTEISLAPGSYAMLTTGSSPVGASFLENACSGYLTQFQDFSPIIYDECPSPADELSLSADNIKTYGEACFDFLAQQPL